MLNVRLSLSSSSSSPFQRPSPPIFAFVVLGLVSSVLSEEIGWEERLQNDLFCVDWGVKPQLNEPT